MKVIEQSALRTRCAVCTVYLQSEEVLVSHCTGPCCMCVGACAGFMLLRLDGAVCHCGHSNVRSIL